MKGKMMVCCIDSNILIYAFDRNSLMFFLAENKVQTRPVWYLNHLQKPYKNCQNYRIEKAVQLWEKTLNIPCSVNLTLADLQKTVIKLSHRISRI